MGAQAIWWDEAKNSYVCTATASVASDVATYAAIRGVDGRPQLGLGTQLLCTQDGYLYLYDGAEFKKFGG